MHRLICFVIAVQVATGLSRANGPTTAEQAVASIEIAPGYEVELVAAEPLVQDPVDFDWGADGRLWVVEMADYPHGIDGKGTPGGRIRVLEDTDGDGSYDHATLFAEGLSTPNGVLVWRGGILVTAAPDVLYLEDTTGDGRADRQEVLFTGFVEGNEQHRVNGLRWGLDNWVHLANGDSGGVVASSKTGESIDIRGRDLRIRPDAGLLESTSGKSQFGRNRDDWGNWFGCNNPNPIFHYVLDAHYVRRNPHVTAPVAQLDIRQGDRLVYPIGPIISHCDTKYRKIGATPQFTAASATMVYRDTLFGPDYQNVTFTSEPVYNIVHARRLIPRGVTFDSVKVDDGPREFFRSTNPWCRPTGIHVGPDGALYVADMMREVIEHPAWIDDDLERQLDVRAGAELGRIYRIIPQGSPRRATPRLDRYDTLQLVEALDSPSGRQRDLVHRMLIWNADHAAIAPLEQMARQHPNPRARLHALCALDGLQRLEAPVVRAALADAHPSVRRHAVRLSERFLKLAETSVANVHEPANWQVAFHQLADDPDPLVRLQVAYAMGECRSQWASQTLARLAVRSDADPYLIAAVLSSVNEHHVGEVTGAALDHENVSFELLAKLAATAARVGDSSSVAAIFAASDPSPFTWSLLGRWFAELGNRGGPLESHLDVATLDRLDELLDQARQVLLDEQAVLSDRAAAARLLGRRDAQRAGDIELLSGLVAPQNPAELQQAAIAALSATDDPQVLSVLIGQWRSHSPSTRSSIIDALLGRTAWTHSLLKAIDEKTILAAHLSAAHRRRLARHGDLDIREQALKLLDLATEDRSQVLVEYRSALDLVQDGQVDAVRGQVVFAKICAACHWLDQAGHAVGPDLTTLANRSPTAIYTAILDPNRAVEAKYLGYQVVTLGGRVHNGILTAETATSLTVTSAEGKRETMLRSEIDLFQCSDQSMMPLGMEKDLTAAQLADLIQYVIAAERAE